MAPLQPTTANSQLHLTRRGRIVFSILAMLTMMPVVGFWSVAQSAPMPSSVESLQTVVVASGDTLWGYAKDTARPGSDLRDVVAEIKSINHLPTADIQAGQLIYLPIN